MNTAEHEHMNTGMNSACGGWVERGVTGSLSFTIDAEQYDNNMEVKGEVETPPLMLNIFD